MHVISYRPTDLSLLKEFSKKISFKDFHNFIWTRLSKSSGSCLGQEDCIKEVQWVVMWLPINICPAASLGQFKTFYYCLHFQFFWPLPTADLSTHFVIVQTVQNIIKKYLILSGIRCSLLSDIWFGQLWIKRHQFIALTFNFNTSYLTDSYIGFTLKMESVLPKIQFLA